MVMAGYVGTLDDASIGWWLFFMASYFLNKKPRMDIEFSGLSSSNVCI